MEIDVIKIGGSLFPDSCLTTKLASFLNKLQSDVKVIVSGGGAKVRNYEKTNLDPNSEKEHWDCIKIMTLNAQKIGEALTPPAKMTDGLPISPGIFFLDAYSFCKNDTDSKHKPVLPCSRSVRSDTISLRYAIKIKASRLWLLKSCTIKREITWLEASKAGLVDDFFGEVIKNKPDQLKINWMNFLSLS